MSFPIVYPQPESLSIPSQLMGDDMKKFSGATNVVKSIPSTSGSNVGPSSTILFQIPTGGNAFIKPNSMYLRAKVVVTLTGAAGVNWKFAGSAGPDAAFSVNAYDYGGASSLLNRVNVNLGGTVMTYQNYNHFRNAVLPHCLNGEYFRSDLRQLEYAGVTKLASTDVAESKTIYVSIPLWVPIFNANQAFPSLLMNSPITVEFLTETVNNAFSGSTNAISGYSLSELNLVYEEIQVSPEFKSALVSSKSGQMFNIHVNDWWSVGPTNADQSMRYQIGCGLSSLKSVLFTEQLTADVASSLVEKKYSANGLLNYTIYVNNFPVSSPNITDDSYCFAEMNRALQKINDADVASFIEPINNTNATGVRSGYVANNFLAGASTMTISDWGYSSSGVPASTVTIELNHGTQTASQWQYAATYASSSLYAFLLHDSVVSIDVTNGVASIRK